MLCLRSHFFKVIASILLYISKFQYVNHRDLSKNMAHYLPALNRNYLLKTYKNNASLKNSMHCYKFLIIIYLTKTNGFLSFMKNLALYLPWLGCMDNLNSSGDIFYLIT